MVIGLVMGGCAKTSPSATKPAPSADAAVAPAAASVAPGIASSRATVAGRLVVRERNPASAYELVLDGKVVVKTDANAEGDPHALAPQPSVPMLFEQVAPYDQVAVIRWDGMGNACNGYGYSFLGLKKDGSFELAPTIDFCGGPEPTITKDGNRLTFVVPEHAPNRGTERVPGETWIYENGRLSRR